MSHATHCCIIHGCKYGESDCPVAAGIEPQKHPCRTCGEMYEEYKEASIGPFCPDPRCRRTNVVFLDKAVIYYNEAGIGRDSLATKCLSCGLEGPKEDFFRRAKG